MSTGQEAERHPASIGRWIPGVRAIRTYQRSWTRPDVVAGVVLAAILVPQGMAYAELAGLPPVTGLYTTIGCLVGYAIFGPSRILVLGPDSSISPMIFAALVPLLVGGDTHRAIALAGMLAVIVALIEIGMGLARLGFVADLLSNEVQVGYMNGLALVIIVGQLPKLCGFSTDADGFGPELKAFFVHLDSTVGAALAVGLGVLLILLIVPRFTRKLPAVLVAIVAATIVSAVFDLHAHGVPTVGTLPRGIPKPSLPWTKFADIGPLLIAAVGITLVSLADTIATSSSFGARRGEEVDPNQEMIGIGVANLAAGCLQGFAVSTSGSRTAVVEQAGAKTQLASVVGAGIVAVLLLFFNSLLADLPQSALAGGPHRCCAVLARPACARPVLAGPQERTRSRCHRQPGRHRAGGPPGHRDRDRSRHGLVLPAGLAAARGRAGPGRLSGRVAQRGRGTQMPRELPGIVIFRWEAPLFFANSSSFRNQIRRIVKVRDVSWVVIQCEAITDIDVSAAQMLEQFDQELNAQGVHMAFVEMRARLQHLVQRYGLFETLDRDQFYPTLESGLATIQGESGNPGGAKS